MEYQVKIPYYSYTEHIVKADNKEQAEEIAIATNDEEQQLLDNAVQTGQIEVEEIKK